MKRLLCSVALLAALVAGCSIHVWHLSRETQALSDQLEQAGEAVQQGDWEKAYDLTQQAWEHWEDQMFYLHTTLHHEDIDGVSTAFQETLAILEQREQPGEYAAANARILYQLELLVEAELPSLKNIL